MADQPKTPQMNVRVDRELRAQAIAIARVRGERDALGTGVSAVVRRSLTRYVTTHKDELPDWWRDLL